MTRHEDTLIARLLGDAPGKAALRRWLATDDGRSASTAHRRGLDALEALFGAVEAKRLVYWDELEAPFGRVLVAVGDAGLVRIGFPQSEASFVRDLRRRFDADAVRSRKQTADAAGQLRAYFAGDRRRFDLPVDLARLTGFQRHVLDATAAVPAGRVASYGEIARRIGSPRGSRAVGQALGHNPIPIVIPCHRIVAAGGRIGGYAGGLRIKRTLLRLEGAVA